MNTSKHSTSNKNQQLTSMNASATPETNPSPPANTSSTPDLKATPSPNITSLSLLHSSSTLLLSTQTTPFKPTPDISICLRNMASTPILNDDALLYKSSKTEVNASCVENPFSTPSKSVTTSRSEFSPSSDTTSSTESTQTKSASSSVLVATSPPSSPKHYQSAERKEGRRAIKTIPRRFSPPDLFSALQDLSLTESTLHAPASQEALEKIGDIIIWLCTFYWELNVIPLWSDNGVEFILHPYLLSRHCVTSPDNPGIHHLLRKCTVKGYNESDFPFLNGQFLIIPVGRLLVNKLPTSWIVAFGEDKAYWLLRDTVTTYLVEDIPLGNDYWYESDPEDLSGWVHDYELGVAEEVEALRGFNIARVVDLAELMIEPQGFKKIPPGFHLYDGTWSTSPVS